MVVRDTTERDFTTNLRTFRLVEASIGNFINLLLLNSSFIIHAILKAHLHILLKTVAYFSMVNMHFFHFYCKVLFCCIINL